MLKLCQRMYAAMTSVTSGINPTGIPQQDRHAGHNHADRGDRIGEIVQVGGPHIEIAARHGEKQHRGAKVHGERNGGHDDDDPAVDISRCKQAVNPFADEVQSDDDKDGEIDQCADDLGSTVAERASHVGRPASDAASHQRNHERAAVVEVVQRIGQQCQTSCQQAGDRLDERQQQVQRDGGRPTGDR